MNASSDSWTRRVHRLGLFDQAFYNRQLRGRGERPVADEERAFLHWATLGVENRLVPTPLFDPGWYDANHRTQPQAGEFGFQSFVESGLANNKSPTPWLSAGWYQARYNSPKDVSSLQHWLQSDAAPLPHFGFQGWLRRFGDADARPESRARRRAWLEGLTQATLELGAKLPPAAFTAMAALFDPAFYRDAAGLDPETPDLDAFVDFLSRGLPSNVPPSRLFDAHYYMRSAAAAGLPEIEPGVAPYEHWLQYGVLARVVPTPMFDSAYYTARYEDIRGSDEWPFLHFIVHGINEERSVSSWFDLNWLKRRLPATPDETPTPRRFFASPSPAATPLKELERWAPAEADGREWLAALTEATLARPELTGHSAALAAIFCPQSYMTMAALDRRTSALDAFIHFLAEGLPQGLSPTPLFDAAHYLDAIEGREAPPPGDDEPPLLHWLTHGVKARIVPTPLFDEDYYSRERPERAQEAGWPFWRYLTTDVWEGLDPSALVSAARGRSAANDDGVFSSPQLFFLKFSAMRDLPASRGFDAWRDQASRPLYDRAKSGAKQAAARITLALEGSPWREFDFAAELVAAMFDPDAFARVAGAPTEASQTELFAQFLESGGASYEDACTYFDAEFYAQEAQELGLPAWEAGDNLLLHWLRHGLAANARPSAILSVATADAVEDAVEHYLVALTSAEIPLLWFDRAWYANRYKINANAALRHFLSAGAGKGFAPLPGLQTPWYAAELSRIATPEQRRRWQLDFLGALARELDRAGWGEAAPRIQWAAAIFLPEWYVSAAKLPVDTRPSDAFLHFVGSAATGELAPTPLFDADFYLDEAMRRGLPAPAETQAGFLPWLYHGLPARVIPWPLFDEDWCAAEYAEASSADEWPFFAFARDHIREGRSPTPLFHAGWYEARYKVDPSAPIRGFLHYLMIGSHQGWLPNPAFEAWMASVGTSRTRPAAEATPGDGLAWLAGLTQSALALPLAARQNVRMAIALFLPEHYKRHARLPDNESAAAAFAHFLSEGLAAGLSPSPLFNGRTYRDKLKARRLPEPGPDDNEFAHWLAHGVPARIAPTALYDENYQIQVYPDLKASRDWAFEHFLVHGVREGRNPNPLFATAWYLGKLPSRPAKPFYHYLLHGAAMGLRPCADFGAPPDPAGTTETPLERVLELSRFDAIQERFERGALAEAIERLKRIDPTVTRPIGYRRIVAPPYSHALWPVVKRVRLSLPRPDFANVVCIPHCRLSGAARVAGHLTKALKQLYPEEPLLLVRTELSNFERPGWFSSQLHNLDLSAELGGLTDPEKQRVLLDLLTCVEPKRIFNVNSNLAWQVFRAFGDRLCLSAELYAYMFCYDIDLTGEKAGYPIEFFETTFPHLKRVLVDSDYLKADLTARHTLPPTLASRLARLWTPLDDEASKAVAQGALHAERFAKRDPARPWRALWAGRLDRQKRFDIVEAIAARLPELEIVAFGASVLGDAGVSGELPPNLKLSAGFADFASLPLGECDFLLYTSQWDGVPTLLIDAACHGMTVVGSRVWGTADLLSQETAYPVEDVVNPDAYVEAIRALMANPGAAVARATGLRARAVAHHKPARYLSELAAALANQA